MDGDLRMDVEKNDGGEGNGFLKGGIRKLMTEGIGMKRTHKKGVRMDRKVALN